MRKSLFTLTAQPLLIPQLINAGVYGVAAIIPDHQTAQPCGSVFDALLVSPSEELPHLAKRLKRLKPTAFLDRSRNTLRDE
ncbi:MAG: hypothetical protein HC924_12760 [Synechococcaceae cyanobacterium SM2_3_2]|nr:hypothetical protein [Synechococcaceae cyanobacterium SM2_3_2]